MKINFEKAVSYIDTLYENEAYKRNILTRQNTKNF